MLRRSLGVVFFLGATALSAQQFSVDIDPAKTEIHWTLVGNVHTVHGTFKLKRGHVDLNGSNGTMTGELLVDSASGESGNGARDKRMRKEILECERFPDIKLTPQKLEGAVKPAGHSTVRVSGTFTIHGTAHEVTVPMELTVTGEDVSGTGKFSVPYVDWGMKDPSNFLFKVDKAVEVEVVASGKLTAK